MAPTGAPVPRRNHGEVPSEPLSRSPTVAPGDDVPCSKGRPSIPIIPGSPGHVSLIDARLGGGGPERDLVPASGNPTIAALDRQIALLGRQVDAFREERDKLAQLVWGERADIDIGPSRTETPHQAPGPARRERSQPRIREAQPSHADLLAEIRKVQDLLLLRAVPAASTLTHDEEDLLPITQEQESGTDGERSMELATPLMPSIAVPDPAHADANVNGMSPFLLPRTDELAGPPAEEEEEEEEEGVLIDL
ncbi:hypothetical protein NEOLEDRAFT_788325 [Neolentinus lepideus HHB14362 ss-1]|uniref:Uncharacterized protein n=1 Tax=Neolentinus lepideus HHB14362 ss-1 TaxID=1314782 RepID=A0A165PJL9_9AGAM|nr:hypothetical protein NEOLEDRAFT_788325 [Neolentinus lepideus HHB14362 ss-1]